MRNRQNVCQICLNRSLTQVLRMTDQEAEILRILQEQIDILRDQLNSISRMKCDSKADVIIKVLDIISLATSNNSLEPYSKTIQRVVSISESLSEGISACGKVILDRCMRFSVVLRDCCSETWRKEVRAPLRICYPHNSVGIIDYYVTRVRSQQHLSWAFWLSTSRRR